MKFRKYLTAIIASVGMLVLILDSKTAIIGANQGIELCIRTLIPALFPFVILSNILTGTILGSSLKALRPLAKLCRIPEGCEALLAVGFLGGYPVGAQNISLAYSNGQISRTTARRMMAFCNNAGPSFLFGIIAPMFQGMTEVWLLWLIHIVSAILVSLVIPGGSDEKVKQGVSSQISFTKALERGIRIMATICGWVILFRMLLQFLDRWILWSFPIPVRVLISGILELSNGCLMLTQISNEGLRFIIASLLLAFGGICITMQTFSVSKACDMSLYFPGKLLQCLFSLLMASGIQYYLFADYRFKLPVVFLIAAAAGCVLCILFLQKSKKTSSIRAVVGV